MKYNFQIKIGFIISIILSILSCEEKSAKTETIRGIYGNPQPLWEKGYKLDELGVNAIFVHSGSIDNDMITRARSEGTLVFAEFATLNGKNYVDEHPEAWPINEKGKKVQAATWFMGVCPTNPGFRAYRFEQLRNLLLEYELDGIWMDYVHWHAQFEDPAPILPETCFCDHCLEEFADHSKIEIPEGTTANRAQWILNNHDAIWRDWRCLVIYDWTTKFREIIDEFDSDVLLGLYHCPWDDQDFVGARRRILGLDYDLLKESVDVFSPMVYHAKMGRDPEWVKENITWFSDQLDVKINSFPKIWPIVQAHNDPGIISKEAFEKVLKGGLAGKASGVMMFTTRAVVEDTGKTEIMKKVYTDLRNEYEKKYRDN